MNNGGGAKTAWPEQQTPFIRSEVQQQIHKLAQAPEGYHVVIGYAWQELAKDQEAYIPVSRFTVMP